MAGGPKDIARVSGGTDLCGITLGPGGSMEPASAVGFIGAPVHVISAGSSQSGQLKPGVLSAESSAKFTAEAAHIPMKTPIVSRGSEGGSLIP